MKPIHTVLALYTVQMAFFAAIWLAMAWHRLSRRATVHWGLATVLLALGMGVVLARPWLPATLGSALPNLVHLAAAALLARGVQVFVHRTPSDGWLLAVAGSAALVVAGANAIGAPHDVTVVAAGLGMGVILLRAAHDVRTGLAGEFGRAAAWACSVPLWIIAGMLGARGVAALVGVSGSGVPLDTGQTRQVALSLALVLLAMAMHLAMAAMLTLRATRTRRPARSISISVRLVSSSSVASSRISVLSVDGVGVGSSGWRAMRWFRNFLAVDQDDVVVMILGRDDFGP